MLALLIIQIQFLPYHNGLVAWTQRIALLFDLALVWWLWRKVISGGESQATAPRASSIAVGMGVLFSLLAIAFSCAIATFPGEWQDDLLPTWAVTTHNGLFSAEPDEFTHRRFPFSNTLVLPGLNVYEGLGIDDPEKAKWRDYVFRPRGRDLRGAIFAFASLPSVDFTGADLQGARLGRVAQRSFRARRSQAQLQGASLHSAQLQGASLDKAQLQGAKLYGAQLQGASLTEAQLQGAWLTDAQLQGAWLAGAELQGALVAGAQLQGVSFSGATLKATDLHDAYLWRSNQAGNPASLSAISMWENDKTWQPRWQRLEAAGSSVGRKGLRGPAHKPAIAPVWALARCSTEKDRDPRLLKS